MTKKEIPTAIKKTKLTGHTQMEKKNKKFLNWLFRIFG